MGCDEYVKCAVSVAGRSDEGGDIFRSVFEIATAEGVCENKIDDSGKGPNDRTGYSAPRTPFELTSFQLAKCQDELGTERGANIEVSDYYDLKLADDSFLSAFTDLEEIYVPSSAVGGPQEYSDEYEAVRKEWWTEIQYCQELPSLYASIKDQYDSQSVTDAATAYARDRSLFKLLEEYVVDNDEFLEMLSNRTQLDSTVNPNGDAGEYLSKCALAISAKTDFSVTGDESMCKDLSPEKVDIPDEDQTDSMDYEARYLEYCEACEAVDFFFTFDETKTKECIAFFFYDMVSAGSSLASQQACCEQLTGTDGAENRKTFTTAGANLCSMTDTDCKDKVKLYIESNAKPIGIIVLIEVIFMYAILYITLKAIEVFRKEGEEDDEEEEEEADED